jgi:two-component system, cell cycle response regulator
MNLPLATIASRVVGMPCVGFPRSLEKVDRLLSEGDAPLTVVTSIIATDPLLTALILGTANATSTKEITQLSDALVSVGLGAIHGLVRSAGHIPDARRKDIASCWALANATGTMVRVLAAHCSDTLSTRIDDETLHAAGLLHDLGTVVAMLHFGDEYQRACDRLDDGQGPLPKLMRDTLGADPPALGTLFATNWRLPSLLVAPLRHHHRPLHADGYQELACLVHVARALVRACGFIAGRDRFLDPIDEDAMKLLRITVNGIAVVLDRFYEEMEELELYEGALIRG